MTGTVVGSGVGGSVGVAAETAFGTWVTSAKWLEFESESIKWNPSRTTGKGIRNGGLVPRRSARLTTTATVAGSLVTPVYGKGMGLFLANLMGSMAMAPVVQGATVAYLQTHALARQDGQSLSLQIGRPTMDGVLHPYNYKGLKIIKGQFEAKVNEALRATFDFDGKDYDEAGAYGAPVYQTANPYFAWEQGVFSMGTFGAEVPVSGVRGWTLTIDRPSKTDNFYLDGTGRKGAQVQNDFMKISGALETDFLSKTTFADLFAADTPQSMIVTFTGPLIAGAFSQQITFRLPSVQWDDEPPTMGGPDIIQPKMTFTVNDDDTNVPATITYMSTDVTL